MLIEYDEIIWNNYGSLQNYIRLFEQAPNDLSDKRTHYPEDNKIKISFFVKDSV